MSANSHDFPLNLKPGSLWGRLEIPGWVVQILVNYWYFFPTVTSQIRGQTPKYHSLK